MANVIYSLNIYLFRVSEIQKAEMVEALSKSGEDGSAPRAVPIDEGIVSQLTLSHFVSCNTKNFFDAMHIETDFLEQDPGRWDSNEHYIVSRKRVQQLKIVNDAVECGVSLINTELQFCYDKPGRTKPISASGC